MQLKIPYKKVDSMSLTNKYDHILKNNLNERFAQILKSTIPDQLPVFEMEFVKLRAERDGSILFAKMQECNQKAN